MCGGSFDPQAWPSPTGTSRLTRPSHSTSRGSWRSSNLTPDSFSDGGPLRRSKPPSGPRAKRSWKGRTSSISGANPPGPGPRGCPPKSRFGGSCLFSGPSGRLAGALGRSRSRSTPRSRPSPRRRSTPGADAINDVSAGREDPADARPRRQAERGLILMHRLQRPDRDSYSDRYAQPPEYGDVVATLRAFLAGAHGGAQCHAAFRDRQSWSTPALGFGKTVEQNLELIRRTARSPRWGIRSCPP